MILTVSGKVSDMCTVGLYGAGGKHILTHNGYVPRDLGIGGGDYIELEIDTDTGKILNWQPLTEKVVRLAVINA